MNRYWLSLLALAVVVAGVSSAAPAALAATTYYTSPSGSGSACSEAAPCSIEEAAEVAEDGDSVVVEPGSYGLPGNGVGIYTEVDFGGRPGSPPPVVETTNSANFYVSGNANAKIHDLRITGKSGVVVSSGIVERVFVDYTGPYSSACVLGVGTTMRDSTCWQHNSSVADGLLINAPGDEGEVVLRNDDFVSKEGSGIFAEAEGGGNLKVAATNVIALGHEDVDISTSFSGFSFVEFSLSHSDYATVEEFAPFTTITPPGTNGNITATPAFVDAANGSFAEPASAPTVDAGLNDPANGAKDILGNDRILGTCIGGTAVTDIGAYEFVPTAPCPSSTPPPAPVAPSNAIKVGKLIRNVRKGTAKLAVSVPDAGTLTLSGKGAKKATRSSKGAATLKLPIVATGKAKALLRSKGKAKLKLTLKFSPTGGTSASRFRKVTLIKKLS
jgi:hypothetical protein